MGGIIDNDTLLSQLLFKELKNYPKLNMIKPEGDAIIGARNMGLRTIKEMQN